MGRMREEVGLLTGTVGSEGRWPAAERQEGGGAHGRRRQRGAGKEKAEVRGSGPAGEAEALGEGCAFGGKQWGGSQVRDRGSERAGAWEEARETGGGRGGSEGGGPGRQKAEPGERRRSRGPRGEAWGLTSSSDGEGSGALLSPAQGGHRHPVGGARPQPRDVRAGGFRGQRPAGLWTWGQREVLAWLPPAPAAPHPARSPQQPPHPPRTTVCPPADPIATGSGHGAPGHPHAS